MKLYAPKYYSEFKCIADKCTHSCCIGWEIDIDPNTLEKYSVLDCNYGDTIRKSIVGDVPHFALCQGERCPHLDSKGLCKIISLLGEGYLCDICREHPRFYVYAPDRVEMGVGMSCYAAASLILSSDYALVQVGERDGEAASGLDTVALREHFYAILGDGSLTYGEKLRKIYSELDLSALLDAEVFYKRIFSSLEYLYPENQEKFSVFSPSLDAPAFLQKPLENALAYFILRHCTEALDVDDYRARMGFCLICERLLCSLFTAFPSCDRILLACAVSEELEYSTANEELITDAVYELITAR